MIFNILFVFLHQIKTHTTMKKTLIALMFLCLGCMAVAQEKNETKYELTIGDTVVWKPFDGCLKIGYIVSNAQPIEFSPTKLGDCIQVIAKQAGYSNITATCSDKEEKVVATAIFIVKKPYTGTEVGNLVKPATQPFTATYNFNPPADHFFITVNNLHSDCRETFVKVGTKEAFNDGQGIDRFWDIKTGENWYYRPEAQGWTDDLKWEFEPLGESFYPLDAFFTEVKDKSNLSQYYVGMERVLDINCWHFFVDFEDGLVIQYWVDPANGCTLKRQMNNDLPRAVTVYDLNYTKLQFGPYFKKGLHDTRR